MTQTHWRKLRNQEYLGSWDLTDSNGKFIELVVTITKMESKIVKNSDGEKSCPLAYFKEFSKPMIINVRNAEKISELHNTNFVENWVGKSVTLYVSKVKVGRETVDALRIKAAKQPAQPAKEELNSTHPKWDGALAAIKSGATTIEAIESKYKLTEETKKLLL
jgi:hypothetical protein